MTPLFKVTIEATADETFYVRAETDDFALDIAMEELFDDTLGYFSLDRIDVDEADEDEVDEDEDEVLS